MRGDPVLLVGLDGSEASVRALRFAARMAEGAGGSLRVVFVEHLPPAVHTAPIEAAGAAAVAGQAAADHAHLECELALAGRFGPMVLRAADRSAYPRGSATRDQPGSAIARSRQRL